MPYSVSIPQILGTATRRPYRPLVRRRARWLEVLAGGDALDRATTLGLLLLLPLDERAHVDDALALLAGDLGPVVGVRRVGEVLVLLVLLVDRRDEVLGA